jgi:uncharacterized protein DUF2163
LAPGQQAEPLPKDVGSERAKDRQRCARPAPCCRGDDLATCWKITRRDGVVLGFTDHVRDLDIASGFTRAAIRGTADLAVGKLDVESVFAHDGITEEDLRAGEYDRAGVRMFLINYQDQSSGAQAKDSALLPAALPPSGRSASRLVSTSLENS